MDGLAPRTTYHYRFGSAADGLTPPAGAAPLSFRTPPALGDPAPLRLAFFGDMGVTHAAEAQALLGAWAGAGALDLAHHAGDISYADNRLDGSVPSHEARPEEHVASRIHLVQVCDR